MIRCDFGCGSTSASTRSATAVLAERLERARDAPRLDVLGDLAQRELAQRAELVGPEEVLERDRGAFLRIDLAGPQALLQLLRRQVDEHDLVGLVEDPVGERLAHADLGELEDRVVEALEVLDVDGRDHVDAGVEHLLDVLPALLVPHPRRVRVRELVDERELRARARSRRRGPSPRARAFRAARAAAARPRALRRARSSRGGRAARGSRSRRPAPPPGPAGPRAACGTSCRRPPPSRAGSGSGLAPLRLTLRSRLWTIRSISLIPTNGRITPPSP